MQKVCQEYRGLDVTGSRLRCARSVKHFMKQVNTKAHTVMNKTVELILLNVVAMMRNKATYKLFGKKYYIRESA